MKQNSARSYSALAVMVCAVTFCGGIAGSEATWAAQTKAPAPQTASQIKVETIAEGLDQPWSVAFLPDGRFLVTEITGKLRIVSPDGKISPPISGVPEVLVAGQGGLLDVQLSPDFVTSKEIFFTYSESRDGLKNGTTVAKAKLTFADDGQGALNDVTVIFRQTPAITSNLHFGSRIVFESNDTMFVTFGDRGIVRKQAQDETGYLGKIIRIDRDGKAAADNPKPKGWKPEIWSMGHRNVQGATMHPETKQLWSIEHGARGGDELNHPEAGKNYGWPVITYGRDYSYLPIGEGQKKDGMEQPVYYWDPSIAPSGLAIYNGDLFPDWKGNMFVGALSGQHLARLVIENNQVVAEEKLLRDLGERIRDVRQGPDGALWVLTDDGDGKLMKITPNP